MEDESWCSYACPISRQSVTSPKWLRPRARNSVRIDRIYNVSFPFFLTIGPFKGTMGITSAYPSGRNNWSTYNRLCTYLDFVQSIHDHRRLVFVDKKHMKKIMIYREVQIDPFKGVTPNHTMEANSKNRYSILVAICIKGGRVCSVESEILD